MLIQRRTLCFRLLLCLISLKRVKKFDYLLTFYFSSLVSCLLIQGDIVCQLKQCRVMSYHLSSHPLYSISHRASASITFICPNCYLMLAPLILSNIEVTPLFPRILIPNLISPSMYTHPYQNPPFMKLAFSEHECS